MLLGKWEAKVDFTKKNKKIKRIQLFRVFGSQRFEISFQMFAFLGSKKLTCTVNEQLKKKTHTI